MSDKPFVWEAMARGYEPVVVRQFGTWDTAEQQQYFDDKWSRAMFEVVELEGEPVGAIWVTDEDDHLWLHDVVLLPEYQRRGIGTTLVREELSRARSLGKPLWLRVLKENRARNLYTRLGFTIIGEVETHFWMEAV